MGSQTLIYTAERIEIGDNVLIGGGWKIYDTDFHSLNIKNQNTPEDKNNAKKRRLIIQDNVFIGASSMILKGVTIGKNSIVGAGSVVNCNIPENQIWRGNPAVKIRDLVQ